MFEEHRRNQQNETTQERIRRLKTALEEADAVVLGAGAGLSTAAGYRYAGERFERYFRDFIEKYGITDMYSGGFYPFGEGDATGINSLTSTFTESEGAIYNVAGQRVSKMQKGVNIVGGKKILK